MLGPSGSGKSTLLNLLGGLDRPTSGKLFCKESEPTSIDDKALTGFRRREVGFIFRFYDLMPSLTAEENVRLVTDIADYPMDPLEALALVGPAERRDHYPAQLSGGEPQRVAVARAITKQPGVLLFDEPIGALDSATGIRVPEALVRANEELQTTVVVITHNAGIAKMADRVFHFLDGRIASTDHHENPVAPSEMSW